MAQTLVPLVRRVPQSAPSMFTGQVSSSYIRFLTKTKAYQQILQVRRGGGGGQLLQVHVCGGVGGAEECWREDLALSSGILRSGRQLIRLAREIP